MIHGNNVYSVGAMFFKIEAGIVLAGAGLGNHVMMYHTIDTTTHITTVNTNEPNKNSGMMRVHMA